MRLTEIIQRNIIYFYISFFCAGAQNIIPQLFYSRFYPQEKGLLLSVTLVLSSFAAIAAVTISGKKLGTGMRPAIVFFFITMGGFGILVSTTNILFFILMILCAGFGCNYLYNYLDHSFLDGTPNALTGFHIKTILVYQMAGYMLSPLYFSTFGQKRTFSLWVVLLLSMLAAILVYPYTRQNARLPGHPAPAHVENKPGKFNVKEKLFIVYSMFFMTVTVLALSMMVYMISDYYKLTGYALKSGIVMMIIVLLSCLTVVFSRPYGKQEKMETAFSMQNEFFLFRPWVQVAAVLVMMISILLFLLKLSTAYGYVMLACVFAGPGYGLFLTLSRNYASNMDIRHQRTSLLSAYNNTQGIATLAGNCILLSCWFLAKRFKTDYLKLAIGSVLGLLILSLLVIGLWVHLWQKEQTEQKEQKEQKEQTGQTEQTEQTEQKRKIAID